MKYVSRMENVFPCGAARDFLPSPKISRSNIFFLLILNPEIVPERQPTLGKKVRKHLRVVNKGHLNKAAEKQGIESYETLCAI